MHLLRKAHYLIRTGVKSFGTAFRKASRRSDRARWTDSSNLLTDWDSRTQRIAELIKPNSSVLEFGAGRMVLKQYLPDNCTYTPSDIVARGKDTLICDLNSTELPRFPPHDIAVFSGVLEYIHDVPRLISHLSKSVTMIVASYAVTDFNPSERYAQGLVNNYSSDEIIALFEKNGFFRVHSEQWQSQIIYTFRRK